MYRVWFSDGKHETFGCLACGRAFVSKRSIERHFARNPAHAEVTITRPEIEGGRTRSGGDDVRRGVARRRLIRRLSNDSSESTTEAGVDLVEGRLRRTDSPEDDTKGR